LVLSVYFLAVFQFALFFVPFAYEKNTSHGNC
jgi:hypothetical protein